MTDNVTSNDAALPMAPKHNWFVRILLILICAVLASMWVYYFVFASDKGVYQLQDTRWREQGSSLLCGYLAG